jgi:protein phosphatase
MSCDSEFLWTSAARTDIGLVRSRNEDAYLAQPQRGLWAVADGMGGHEAGDVASRTVVEELGAIEPAATAAELLASCETRMFGANVRLKALATERGALVGTTVAILLAFEASYAIVWAGDSRLYLIRNDAIEQLSLDHTEVQELLTEGMLNADEARAWPRNVITRAIGVHDEPELEMRSGTLAPGDIFVLCSDGLTGYVKDHEILELAKQHPPQATCDALVALTLERGAADNVTVVAVRFNDVVQPAITEATMRVE